MAIIKCTKCNNEISDNDTKCLVCGTDLQIIRYELKRRELIEEGKIRPNKKKNIVIAFELIIILSIALIYIKLFVPKILNIDDNKNSEEKTNCKSENGTWDNKNKICIYDY